MTEPVEEEPIGSQEPITVELTSEIPPEIEFAIPAPAYDSIATVEDAVAFAPLISTGETASGPPLDLSPALHAIAGLHQKMDALGVAFEREVRAEATREKIVDRLHAELQDYKQDLVLSLMKPVFLDLIQLHDDVGKMMPSQAEGDTSSANTSALADVRQAIEDILYRQGVEPFRSEGEDFDARRQRAVTTVPTEDPAQARKVALRLRAGFASGDRVIRPEIVSVFAIRRS